MCRSSLQEYDHPAKQSAGRNPDPNGLLHLDIKAFYLRLSLIPTSPSPSSPNPRHHHQYSSLPNSLSLLYRPRMNGSPLQINGFSIRRDAPGFVTLHRAVGAAAATDHGTRQYYEFGSRDRVRVGEGVGFEVYVGEERLIKGTFMRRSSSSGGGGGQCCGSWEEEGEEAGQWSMECRCVLEREINVGAGADDDRELNVVAAAAVEVRVAAEEEEGRRRVDIREKVKVAVKRRFKGSLEEIPEGSEEDAEESEVDRGFCRGSSFEEEEEGKDESDDKRWMEVRAEPMELGVGWAVDIGIWVMCLGTVGYLVSRAASSRRLSRKIM